MLKKLTVVAVAAFVWAMTGCGGSAQVRIYKGTSTTVITSGGTTNTVTTTNRAITVLPGDLPNEWIFLNGDAVYVGTVSGMALTFQGGQGYSESETFMNQMYSLTVSNGSGNLSPESLTLNLSGMITQSSTAGSGTGTYQLMFTGARE